MARRGAFIVLEGLDRSGKSTQVMRLVEGLQAKGVPAVACRFPDRTTTIGKMIDAYLTEKADLDDHAIHLLFSANRWEKAKGILADLEAGTTVVCDRYAFSGIAFTAAKGISHEWCRTPDVGLPAPDLVLFFDLSPEAAKLRGGYGEERYESTVIQTAVRGIFAQIGKDVGEKWHVVDARESIDLVTSKVAGVVDRLIEQEKGPVGKLWQV